MVTAPQLPDLTELANIQTALKYLYYGNSTTSVSTSGIYGMLSSLQTQITATQAGINVHETCKYATTAQITGTYASGTADASGGLGIGATITFTATGVITLDSGATLALNDRILVKDGVSSGPATWVASYANGIYYVSTAGASGVACVLTRSTDGDNSLQGEFAEGDSAFISAGTLNGNLTYVATSTAPTGTGPAGSIRIGSDPVTYYPIGNIAFGSQTANTVFAAPSGSAGTPSFRRIVYSDLSQYGDPTLSGQVLQFTSGLGATTWTSGTLSLPTSSSLTLSGAFALTLTQTAATNVTLPTTGTLATRDGVETLTNKTLASNTYTSATTLTVANDLVFLLTAGSAFTVTLPTPTAGKQLTLVRTDNSALIITISGHINGTAAVSNTTWFPASTANRRVMLVSNGTSWYPIVAGTVV